MKRLKKNNLKSKFFKNKKYKNIFKLQLKKIKKNFYYNEKIK